MLWNIYLVEAFFLGNSWLAVFRENKMSNKLLLKTPLITAVLLLILLAAPVLADGGGHLWFYSVDPGTLNPPDLLPNPQDYDPNYVGADPDGWLAESIVLPGDWGTPFSIWLGCAKFESLGTKLVISVNDAAAAAIAGITVEGIPVGAWDTNDADFPLPPHGVANSAEWHGFVEANLGNIYGVPEPWPYKIEINIDLTINPGADLSEAKIHFDAYGHTNTGALIFSPFSHDATFVVPEPATMFALGSSLLALGAYAIKRKKQ